MLGIARSIASKRLNGPPDPYWAAVSLLIQPTLDHIATGYNYDEVGNSLQYIGGASVAQGSDWDACIAFPNTTGAMVAASSPLLAMGMGDFTWEVIAQSHAAWIYNSLLSTRPNPTAYSDGMSLVFRDNGALIAYSNRYIAESAAGQVQAGAAYRYFALRREGTSLTIWVNGSQVAAGIDADNLTRTVLNLGNVGDGNEPFYGRIKAARVTRAARPTSSLVMPSAPWPTYG